MKTNLKSAKSSEVNINRIKCVLCFTAVFVPSLFTTMFFDTQFWIMQIFLFMLGWFSWTFIEYFAHRFWMHSLNKNTQSNHLHHHSHPTEIKITSVQRILLLSLMAIFIYFSCILQNYFILFAGFFSGFAGYTFVHVMLHTRWCAKLFPRLCEFHIHHHCKYPDKCFGVTSTWWDYIFKTIPPKNVTITPRIKAFYFGEK